MKAPDSTLLSTVLAFACGLLTARAAEALPDLRITHLQQNGALTFQAVPGYTNYTIEWAPAVGGPWSANWLGLRAIDPQAETVTVQVPMFYRVVARGTPLLVSDRMSYVSSGDFLMGDNLMPSGLATPVHSVSVSTFVIDRREVSLEYWNQVVAWAQPRGYQFDNPGAAADADHPVNQISWYDAVKWCNARSEMEGLAPVYFTDATQTTVYRTGEVDLTNACVAWTHYGYRLPTEAEWEKAARAGLASQNFPWPSPDPDFLADLTGEMANYWGSGDPYDNGTTPVGFYNGFQSILGPDMRNGLGLYDMAGNVAEMCWDRIGSYMAGLQKDPRGPDTGGLRVVRGGSWYDDPSKLRVPARQAAYPGVVAPNLGFRCACFAEIPL